VPVRIVLRGLILVSVNHPGTKEGTITARLISGSDSMDTMVAARVKHGETHIAMEPDEAMRGAMKADHERHTKVRAGLAMNHKHKGEIQIFDGVRDDAGLTALRPGQDLNITIDTDEYVKADESYGRYMPKLAQIARLADLEQAVPDTSLVSLTVTVNRGTIRVRDVGDWDAGAPEIPSGYSDPGGIYQPAKVRFLGVPVYGYVATECVIHAEHADVATIEGPSGLAGEYCGKKEASLRVPEKTVEILITNYAAQQRVQLPWTLHYGWMFRAAGYSPINLAGPELNDLEAFALQYDRDAWQFEKDMFLDGNTGYPFPYRNAEMFSPRLGELDYSAPFQINVADPWDPVRCPMGDLTPGT